MDPAGHRFRADRRRSRGLVEPGARGRTARRQPVEEASGRTGRDCGCGERVPDRTLAKPPGGLCYPGTTRVDRRVPWAGYRGDQLGPSRSFRSRRTAWTQSTLRLGRSPDDPAVMGAIGYFLSYQAIFLASATLALPLLVALSRIGPTEIHFGRACGQPDHHAPAPPPRTRRLILWKNYGLLTFAGCLFLFQFANASMLPLAGEELVYRNRTGASLIVSALIIVPQIVVVLSAPWAGREAQSWGRRPLLLPMVGHRAPRAREESGGPPDGAGHVDGAAICRQPGI